MHLFYNILWIDNDIEDYIERDELDDIEKFLKNLGFIPHIKTDNGDSEINDLLGITNYDLILSDFNLNEKKGDSIVKAIREMGILTEIIFYSANTDFKNDPNILSSKVLFDRVSFHYGRTTLMEKIEEIIKLTLRKLLELNATRGLITSATSSLDVDIESFVRCLVNNHVELTQEQVDKIVNGYITDCLDRKSDKFRTKYEKLGFLDVFSSIEAYRKWKILREILKLKQGVAYSDEVADFLKINKKYYEEVIFIRNRFAHSKEVCIAGEKCLQGQIEGDHFQFNEETCVDIRKKLIKHIESFNNLKKYLSID